MALLETWRNLAYGDGLDDKKKEELWAGYFQIEKGIYEQILSAPTEVITGTVKELAEKYGIDIMSFHILLDDVDYIERESCTNEEFYEKMRAAKGTGA